MHAENCNLMTQDGSFFDITHTFKAGSSTYHILGLRKDRPTYRNNYYIFNCTGNQHELTNESLIKSVLTERSARASERTSGFKHRPITYPRTTTTPIDDLTHPRASTESLKKMETDTTAMKETFTKVMRVERRMLVASLRREMDVKKKAVIRSIKKENEVLLQATIEANNNKEIIRLLDEQKRSLADSYETCISSTTSSIDALKQTLIEILNTQQDTSQSVEQLQNTLIQAIEQEAQKITLKNEEILRLTAAETNAINQLQDALVQKIENYPTTIKHDDEVLNRLFAEQQQVLTDTIAQQQQALSLDLIKRTVIDALDEQRLTLRQQTTSDTTTNISSEQALTNTNTIINKNDHSLPRMKPSQHLHNVNQPLPRVTLNKLTDQHLLKVSIRSPEPARLFAKLVIDGMECSRREHTLCQRDTIQSDVFNCYIAPPTKNGPYEVTIYAKTNKETTYRAAICIRLPGPNISQSITFPLVHQSFEKHQCILIEPLQRLLRQNEKVLIHMIVPGAHVVKIQNGDDNTELDENEYKNGIVKKKIRVRGDVHVIGCWDKKTDSTICIFNTI
jgi:hypothetical protein